VFCVVIFSILRNKLPTLQQLDGQALPPNLEFGDSGDTTTGARASSRFEPPAPTMGTFPNDEVKLSVLNFLKNFLDVYDKNRQSLMQLYSENATLTMHTFNSQIGVNHRPLRIYGEHSRNLLRVRDKDRRNRFLYRGKLQVVSALDRLPASLHLMETIRVDVASSTPAGMLLFMTGVFIERDAEPAADTNRVDKTVRCFSRSLVLVPPLEIQLDDLYVTNASNEVIKHWIHGNGSGSASAAPATTQVVAAPATAAAATPLLSLPGAAMAAPAVLPSEAVQTQLVSEFAVRSGMNANFSRQCLEEFRWDFEVAASHFLVLKERGAVPPEAYLK